MKAEQAYYIVVKNESTENKVSVSITMESADAPKPTGLAVKANEEGQTVVSWTKIKNVGGYQFVYWDQKKPEKKTKIMTAYASGNEIGSLKKGHTYVFRVRAYRQIGNKRYYGEYSDNYTITWNP